MNKSYLLIKSKNLHNKKFKKTHYKNNYSTKLLFSIIFKEHFINWFKVRESKSLVQKRPSLKISSKDWTNLRNMHKIRNSWTNFKIKT